MIQTRAILIDSSTSGGEPIDVVVRSDDKHVIVKYRDDMDGFELRVKREAILAAIEHEEHG